MDDEEINEEESIHKNVEVTESVTEPESTEDSGLLDGSPEKKREDTRSEIAKIYVYAFFIVIAATFIVGLINGFKVNDYKDLLIVVSGILSGPLGFIIGFYFKASTTNTK